MLRWPKVCVYGDEPDWDVSAQTAPDYEGRPANQLVKLKPAVQKCLEVNLRQRCGFLAGLAFCR